MKKPAAASLKKAAVMKGSLKKDSNIGKQLKKDSNSGNSLKKDSLKNDSDSLCKRDSSDVQVVVSVHIM